LPRESRAIPKMIGLENEYGCIASSEHRIPEAAGVGFVLLFQPEWLDLGRNGAWDPTERLAGTEKEITEDALLHTYLKNKNWQSEMNFLLPNGARFYCDMTHPEICIPICRNAQEALLQDRACEWLMNFIRKKHEEVYGHKYVLFKNNTALGYEDEYGRKRVGVSFATHENYLVSRMVDIKNLVEKTIPFLATRNVLIGAGVVKGQASGDDTGYEISQRAGFFGQPIGLDTTGWSRPIYNLRDRPYADPQRFRRVHVITGDANMCETAEFIKFATMQVLFMMIEDEFLDNRFTLKDPVEAMHQISQDLTFQKKIAFKDKRASRTAIDILKEYVGLMGEYLETFDIRDELLRWGIKETERILDLLSASPELCFGVLDHVTKKMIIEGRMESGKISSWQDPKAKKLDVNYHNINQAEGLFYHPRIYPEMKRLLSGEEIAKAAFEPPPTRSRFQVEVYKKFGLLMWDWRKILIADEKGHSAPPIFLEDPAADWEKLEGLLSDDRKEFLQRVKDAGLMESSLDHENPDEKFYGLSYKKGDGPKPRHRHVVPEPKPSIGPIREDDDVFWWPDFSYKKMLDDLKKQDLTNNDPGEYNDCD